MPRRQLQISDAVADVGVPVLVGLVVEADGGEHVANQGTVWDPVIGAGQLVRQAALGAVR